MPTFRDSLRAKLDRALEHAATLASETERLLDEHGARRVTRGDESAEREFIERLRRLELPPRLGVIAGEAVHQIRSTLDHLLVHLIRSDGGTTGGRTGFPIFTEKPAKSKRRKSYEDKVRGLNRFGLDIVEQLQPYHWKRPDRHPLAILQALDDAQKHEAPLLAIPVHRPHFVFLVGDEPDAFSITVDRADDAPPPLKAMQLLRRELITQIVFAHEVGGRHEVPVGELITGLAYVIDQQVLPKFSPFLGSPSATT